MLSFRAVVWFLILSIPGFGALAQEFQIVGPNGKTVVRSEGAPAPDRLLVKVRPGKGGPFQREVEEARALPGAPELFLVPVPKGMSVREAVQRYARRADVLYAEPDAVATVNAVPNDARWSEQWDMVKIAAPAAWEIQTDSSDQVVAVVDTGIDFSHPDLQANVWTDPLDGSHGVTCRNGNVTTGGSDDNGHGTHVAGIIGAVGDNGAGIAGINWSVQLLSLKAFDQYGNGNVSDIVACMNRLVALRQRGFNIRVANHSWSVGVYSQALRDAFSSAEALGILHVVAAGNSTADIDFAPSWPAVFPGRGILAVSSTNSTDGMALFTNFGHVEVDLAAPGHNVLSTVPSGACSRCDASGYKLLSGTSMAAPHVSGVAAAVFHLNPLLTPAEVRDLLLDPASFDPLQFLNNYQVLSSTRGGRLNFAKVLANPLLTTPQLNGFPVISAPARVVRSAGTPVTLTATASDPDGDTLAFQWGKPLNKPLLYGVAMNRGLPPGNFNPSIAETNPYTFTAPSLAITATSEYKALVNDGRGGSAAASTWVTFPASPAPGLPPTGQIIVTPASGPPGTMVAVTYSGADPEGGALYWSSISSYNGTCCLAMHETHYVYLDRVGVYRFNVQAIDPEMNLSEVSTAVVRIGGATGEPPVARLSLSATSGPAPLTVSYDATGSYDPDGDPLTAYYIDCEAWSGSGALVPEPPTGTCVFDKPGPHTIGVRVNSQGSADERIYYVMVTDPLTPDVTAPTVEITAPAAGAPIRGSVAVNVDASDEIGVMRIEVYRDSGVLLGTDTTAPFSVTWDSSNVPVGEHTLYAKAYDQAGNAGTSAAVPVSVHDSVNPAVAVVAPASGASVAGLVQIAADASDNQEVARVEFFRSPNVLLGTDAEAPYAVSWDSSGVTPGVYSLYAKAYDQEGNSATSALVSVTVRDSAPPAASITAPAAGARVGGSSVSVQVSASDNVGVARVELLLDGSVLLGTDTAPPWSFLWNSTSVTPGSHTLSARAYDQQDNVGLSAPVTVMVYDAVNPTVSLLAPASGASVSGPVTLEAQASDNVGVTRVEFFRDSGVLLGADAEAPFSLAWDSSAVTPGSHTLYARAYDQEGNQGSSSIVSVTVRDVTPPDLSITTPPSGASVGGSSIPVNVSASDNAGVTKVELLLDGSVLLGTDTASPWSFTWDSTPVTPGPHTLSARAYDQAGNIGTSAAVAVTVYDAVPPTVSITSPASGAHVSGLVEVVAEASDNVGVVKVDFFHTNGNLLASDTAAPWVFAWNTNEGVGPGVHTITARAYDQAGYSTNSAPVSFTVHDAVPPQVAINSPASGGTVSGVIPIYAIASDNDRVVKVEFFLDNGILLGTDTAVTYEAIWDSSTVTPGPHTLYAKAYDSENVTTSAPVPVTVLDSTPPTVSFTSPAAGASVSGLVAVNAAAVDNVGVVKVDFFRDGGIFLGSDTSAPWELAWDSTTVTPGAHTLEARASDPQGNVSATASVGVTVLDALPPSVSITSPAHGSTVPKNTTITISASASDNVGVARVEIYVGSTLLCTDTASPYSCAWKVPKGASLGYTLQARAYDARGNTASSAVVQVTSR